MYTFEGGGNTLIHLYLYVLNSKVDYCDWHILQLFWCHYKCAQMAAVNSNKREDIIPNTINKFLHACFECQFFLWRKLFHFRCIKRSVSLYFKCPYFLGILLDEKLLPVFTFWLKHFIDWLRGSSLVVMVIGK